LSLFESLQTELHQHFLDLRYVHAGTNPLSRNLDSTPMPVARRHSSRSRPSMNAHVADVLNLDPEEHMQSSTASSSSFVTSILHKQILLGAYCLFCGNCTFRSRAMTDFLERIGTGRPVSAPLAPEFLPEQFLLRFRDHAPLWHMDQSTFAKRHVECSTT